MKIARGNNYGPVALDYALSGVSSALAVYCAAMAISAQTVAFMFVSAVIVGTTMSWLVHRWIGPRALEKLNGVPYAVLAIIAVAAARDLSAQLPENPFAPRELIVASILCWMVILGSLALWSEGTLLFQAVPSMALFGIVGSYDTFRESTYAFFAFMLCFATLFSRSHARSMLRQAAQAGYGPRTVGDGLRTAPTFDELLAGPWRWAAGPGWALASAGVVILLSFIGAPVIQESMKNVSGVVKVAVPGQAFRAASRVFDTNTEQTRVGTGPHDLSEGEEPALRATLDQPRYLRAAIFQRYTGRGWNAMGSAVTHSATSGIAGGSRIAVQKIAEPEEVPFTIEVVGQTSSTIPVPGEVVSVDPASAVNVRLDGTLAFANRDQKPPISGKSIVSKRLAPARNAVTDLRPGSEILTSQDGIPPEVSSLARSVTKGISTDWDRAIRLKAEIEHRVKYNLQAEAAPADTDPVSYFLFQSHEGYCDLFASSMTLMARSIGIPARYVAGYYPIRGDKDPQGRYIIHGAEAHAWAELFFDDQGWVVFDATEGAEEVPGGERGSSGSRRSVLAALSEPAIDVAIGVLLLASLYIGLRPRFKRRPAAEVRRTVLQQEYVRFVRALASYSGQRRHLNQTPREYLESLREHLGGAYGSALALNDRFVRSFYSREPADEQSVSEIKAENAAFRAALKKQPGTMRKR